MPKIIIENREGIITGQCAFEIHSTRGIPPVQLEQMTGMKIDMVEYNRLFDEHRKVSSRSCLKKFGHKSKYDKGTDIDN